MTFYGKKSCPRDRVSLKTQNQSDLKHKTFKKSRNSSISKYANLKIAKLSCREIYVIRYLQQSQIISISEENKQG